MRRRTLVALSLGVALTVAGAPAFAQPKGDSKEVAALVEVGKFAFDKERYSEALRAFEECFRLTRDPKYLWNVAVTAEKAYWASDQLRDLDKTLAALRLYVKDYPDGKRRAEATQALKRLEPLAPKPSETDPATDPGAAPAPAAARTGVMISSSTPGARIELDGKLGADGFLVADVAEGPHRVTVRADGYLPIERDVTVLPGALLGLDLPLTPRPGQVSVQGPSGAELSVNGEPKGDLPLARPLELPPGDHLFAVRMSGARPLVEWRSIERGAKLTVKADLDTTGQRMAAYVTFAFAGAGAIAAGTLTGLAVKAEGDAQRKLETTPEAPSHTETELQEFKDLRDQRDDLRTAAGVAWGVTGAALVSGIFLYVFDDPGVQAAPPPPRKTDDPATPKPGGVELGFVPAIGPTYNGGALVGRF